MIYTLLYTIALLAMLPLEFLKRPVEVRDRWLRERFGYYAGQLRARRRLVWIHAVSVGEAIAATPLVERLRNAYPDIDILVSTVTDTGQKVGRERLGDRTRIIYVPFDLPSAVRGTLRAFNPSLLAIMETELWPNLIRSASDWGIPVVLLNGRISEKSFSGYRKIRPFMRGVLGSVNLFGMQSDEHARRLIELGAPAERVKTIGSFKFDTRPPASVPSWTRLLTPPVVIAGSTHHSEEGLILRVYSEIQPSFPGLSLVIVPRHPERFAEVEEIVKRSGVPYVNRSALGDGGSGERIAGKVVILDAMGELAAVYGAADIAIMGGSFIPRGGQNPLEPAYWSKAIVCGPHMENFSFMGNFYSRKGALQVDSSSLAAALHELLSSPERRTAMGSVARVLYEENAGAADRALALISPFLDRV